MLTIGGIFAFSVEFPLVRLNWRNRLGPAWWSTYGMAMGAAAGP